MPHGTLKRIERDLGFGLIVDDAGMDWFFVRDGVRDGALDRLVLDDRVVFSYEWTARGPRATDIVFEYPQHVH